MKSFTQYLTDPNYISAYDFDGKGIIYIEDENDKRFWAEVINDLAKNRYTFKIATKKSLGKGSDEIKIRGKGALTKLYDTLNKTVMVAVDSDFDYICPENRALLQSWRACWKPRSVLRRGVVDERFQGSAFWWSCDPVGGSVVLPLRDQLSRP